MLAARKCGVDVVFGQMSAHLETKPGNFNLETGSEADVRQRQNRKKRRCSALNPLPGSGSCTESDGRCVVLLLLLPENPLHDAGANADLATDLQHAHACLAELVNAFFH
jgi:hypothetical protein